MKCTVNVQCQSSSAGGTVTRDRDQIGQSSGRRTTQESRDRCAYFLLAAILTAVLNVAFSVLTLSVEHQEEHRND